MGTLKQWLNGLIGGVIGAVSNSVTVMIVDPAKFSPAASGGWKNLGVVATVSAIFGAALYLKQHPTPWDPSQGDRRNGN